MSHTYLLEIGMEEIPARFIDKLCSDLKEAVVKQASDQKLDLDSDTIETYATYRRLAIVINELPSEQASRVEEIKGPPASIAKNGDTYLPPALGFAKKCGVSESELVEKEEGGKPYIYAVKKVEGKPIGTVLEQIIPSAIKSIPLPNAMRWGALVLYIIK